MRDETFRRMAEAGGPIPRIGPVGESFRAGFYNLGGTRYGTPGSLQRKAYQAGRRRARSEPLALAAKEAK